MKNKARFIWTVLLIGVLGLSTLGLATTSTLTGREIIEKVDAAVVADDATLLMTMTLTNDRGESLGGQHVAVPAVARSDQAH